MHGFCGTYVWAIAEKVHPQFISHSIVTFIVSKLNVGEHFLNGCKRLQSLIISRSINNGLTYFLKISCKNKSRNMFKLKNTASKQLLPKVSRGSQLKIKGTHPELLVKTFLLVQLLLILYPPYLSSPFRDGYSHIKTCIKELVQVRTAPEETEWEIKPKHPWMWIRSFRILPAQLCQYSSVDWTTTLGVVTSVVVCSMF